MSAADLVLKPSALGRVDLSPKAEQILNDLGEPLGDLLERHRKGDWGKASPAERAVNIGSILDSDGPVVSVYEMKSEAIIVRTTISPFKSERGTDVRTGWELN